MQLYCCCTKATVLLIGDHRSNVSNATRCSAGHHECVYAPACYSNSTCGYCVSNMYTLKYSTWIYNKVLFALGHLKLGYEFTTVNDTATILKIETWTENYIVFEFDM